MMEAVEALGEEVERLWKKEKYAKEAFSRIAFETLQKNKIHTYFSMEEFLQWLRKTK
ncbi:MAG: hypothetical protein HY590_07900, partial [Candidatus Omnitrophica bacterium]|nr:hypothetical protein [Candidatus Omnitrophota bacterium]